MKKNNKNEKEASQEANLKILQESEQKAEKIVKHIFMKQIKKNKT